MATVDELKVLIKGDNRDYNRALDASERRTRGFSTKIGGMLKTGAAAGATGLAAGLVASTKAAMGFESSWADAKKVLSGSPEEIAKLEAEARQMAKTLPSSHDAIADIIAVGGQLGIPAGQMKDFARTAVDLGNATDLSGDQAATAIAKVANVTGLATEDFDNFGSAMVFLGNNFATTEASMAQFLPRLAPISKQVGLTESQMLGLAATLDSVGINAEAGSSAMQKSFATMQSAVRGGGKDLEKFAEIAGVSGDEFARTFEADPMKALQLFTSGLDRMNKRGEDANGALADVGLQGIRTSQALFALGGAQDTLTSATDGATKAFKDGTAIQEEAEQRYATTASKIQVLKNNLVDVGITIGQHIIPVVADVAERFATWLGNVDFSALRQQLDPTLTALSNLADMARTLATTFTEQLSPGGVSAAEAIGALNVVTQGLARAAQIAFPALNLVAMALGQVVSFVVENPVVSAVAALTVGIVALGGAASVASMATGALMVAVGALTAPVTLTVAAIVGLILVYKNWGSISDWLKDKFGAFADFLVSVKGRIVSAVQGWVDGAMESLRAFPGNAAEQAGLAVGRFLRALVEAPGRVKSAADSWRTSFVEGVTALPGTLSDLAADMVNRFTSFITGAGPRVADSATSTKDSFVSGVANLPEEIRTLAGNVISGFVEGITGGLGRIGEAASDLWNRFVDGVKSGFEIGSPSRVMRRVGMDVVTGLADGVRSLLHRATGAANHVASRVRDGIKDVLSWSNARSWGRSLMSGLNDGLWSMAHSVKNSAASAVSGIADRMRSALGIASPSRVTKEMGVQLMEGLARGVRERADRVQVEVQRVASSIPDWLMGRAGDDIGRGIKSLGGIRHDGRLFEAARDRSGQTMFWRTPNKNAADPVKDRALVNELKQALASGAGRAKTEIVVKGVENPEQLARSIKRILNRDSEWSGKYGKHGVTG